MPDTPTLSHNRLNIKVSNQGNFAHHLFARQMMLKAIVPPEIKIAPPISIHRV